MCADDSVDPGAPGLPPAGDSRRRRHAHGVLCVGPARRNVRRRHRKSPAPPARGSGVRLSTRGRPRERAGRRSLSHQRSGAGVQAVVLPLEQHAGRRAPDAGGAGTASRAGDAREAGAADGGRSEVDGADQELRRPVVEPAGAGHRRSRIPASIRISTTTCGSRFAARSSSCSTASSTRIAASWIC